MDAEGNVAGSTGSKDEDVEKWTLSEEELRDIELYHPEYVSGYEEEKKRERKRGRLNDGWGVFRGEIYASGSGIVDEESDPGPQLCLTVSCVDSILKLCDENNCTSSFVDELFRILSESIVKTVDAKPLR